MHNDFQNSPRSARSILVIENEGELFLLLDLMLKNKNIEIDHVKNLSDANKFLQRKQPALVLWDNRLPDGQGLDFIGRLKTMYPSTKVIMTSGPDLPDRAHALAAGADIFLTKPFTKAKLLHSIKSLLI